MLLLVNQFKVSNILIFYCVIVCFGNLCRECTKKLKIRTRYLLYHIQDIPVSFWYNQNIHLKSSVTFIEYLLLGTYI